MGEKDCEDVEKVVKKEEVFPWIFCCCSGRAYYEETKIQGCSEGQMILEINVCSDLESED